MILSTAEEQDLELSKVNMLSLKLGTPGVLWCYLFLYVLEHGNPLELTKKEIARRWHLSQPTVKKWLKILEDNHIITISYPKRKTLPMLIHVKNGTQVEKGLMSCNLQ